MIRLDIENPAIIDYVPTGRLGYDGSRMVPLFGSMMGERAKLATSGAVFVSVVLDRSGDLECDPRLSLIGITVGGEEQEHLERDIVRAVRNCVHNGYRDLETLKEEIRVHIRRVTNNWIGKKAPTEIHIIQV